MFETFLWWVGQVVLGGTVIFAGMLTLIVGLGLIRWLAGDYE
jgi:hypothetical protein